MDNLTQSHIDDLHQAVCRLQNLGEAIKCTDIEDGKEVIVTVAGSVGRINFNREISVRSELDLMRIASAVKDLKHLSLGLNVGGNAA